MANNFKITLTFRQGAWKWVESTYWTHPTWTIIQARADAVLLATLRRGFLASNVTLTSWSIAGVTDACKGMAVAPEDKNCTDGTGAGVIEATCSDPWLALVTAWYSFDYLYRAVRLFRGVGGDVACLKGKNDYRSPTVLGGDSLTAFVQFSNFLTNNSRSYWGPETARDCTFVPAGPGTNTPCGTFSDCGCVKSSGRGTNTKITDIIVDDGIFYVKLEGDTGLAAQDTIHLHGVGGPGTAGLNGDHRISGAKTTAVPVGYWPLNLREADPNCELVWNGAGRWWKCTRALWTPSWVEVCGVHKRKTGVSGVTRGRRRKRKGRCCR